MESRKFSPRSEGDNSRVIYRLCNNYITIYLAYFLSSTLSLFANAWLNEMTIEKSFFSVEEGRKLPLNYLLCIFSACFLSRKTNISTFIHLVSCFSTRDVYFRENYPI